MKLGKLIISSVILCITLNATSIEVMHWWKSGGEAKAMDEIKAMLVKKGYTWYDYSGNNSGGMNLVENLMNEVLEGTTPVMVQLKGPSLQQWGQLKMFANLNSIADKGHWEQKIPKELQKQLKYKNTWVAIGTNIHRINWLWINPDAFRKIKSNIPRTWDDFFKIAPKLQEAGITPLAMGAGNMQVLTLFENVVLGIGGVDFYKKAIVQLDIDAISSPTMVKVFETLRKIQPYTSKNKKTSWNEASKQVMDGNAAMQIMGDWAKGEFSLLGKIANIDYLAVPAPSTQKSFIYTIDSFAMMKQKNEDKKKAQVLLSEYMLSDKFQISFNRAKGSIPISRTASLDSFDSIAQESMDDLKTAELRDAVLPSMAHQMATNDYVKNAFNKVVQDFYNSDQEAIKAVYNLAVEVKKEK